jgi:hypothetical protein
MNGSLLAKPGLIAGAPEAPAYVARWIRQPVSLGGPGRSHSQNPSGLGPGNRTPLMRRKTIFSPCVPPCASIS